LHRQGFLPEDAAGRDPTGFAAGRAAMQGLLAYLASGPARLVVVNLEDLWGETEPQNIPGTVDEYPNWRRKARYSLEQLEDSPAVGRILNTVESMRSSTVPAGDPRRTGSAAEKGRVATTGGSWVRLER
jgi:4-alpha-glucanotransferase